MPELGAEGTCVELFDSAAADFDVSSGTARRLFLVGSKTLFPSVPGFPIIGESHPRYPGLFCDRIGIQKFVTNKGAGCTEQYALYSSDGRYTGVPERPGVDLERGYLRIDPERGTMSVPFLVANERIVPLYSEDSETGRKYLTGSARGFEWVNDPRTFQFYRTIWSRSVDVLNLDATGRNYITEQTGQIHEFPDGNPYMMLAPIITQKSPAPTAVYSIAYQWVTEPTLPTPGIPPLPGDTGGPIFTPELTDPVRSNFYVTATEDRPPFYSYVVVPNYESYSDIDTGVRISIPRVFVVDSFPDKRSTPLGWQTLPGDPLGGL